MKATAILFFVVAIAAAVIGFKIAIGLIAKICFIFALLLGAGLFIAGVKAGEKIAN